MADDFMFASCTLRRANLQRIGATTMRCRRRSSKLRALHIGVTMLLTLSFGEPPVIALDISRRNT
jgi:hypothetical protein